MTTASQSVTAARRPLRALIAEDREDDLLLLLDELNRGGYAVSHVRVETPDALRDALTTDQSWNVVLSDFSLPTMTAHDVLTIAQAHRPDLPCIVISGTITEETAVDVLKAGARDFIVKERMARLVPAIERELREAADRRRLAGTETTLRETRERMQFVLDAIGVGLWEWHIPSGAVIWSEMQERLHGLQPGAFGGTYDEFLETVHDDDRDDVLRGKPGADAASRDLTVEYRVLWPDGSLHWIASIGRVLSYETGSGAPTHAVGVARDITAQKRLEEQFLQAQKMESIGNLAGGIAHDFNNLLTVISGCCELAAERVASDSDVLESLEGIRGATASAVALTRRLLTFSRRQIVTPRLLDLNESIEGFSKILRRLVEENVRLEFQPGKDIGRVRADPGQVEQLLLNLVANARDAMPDGGTVTIRTSPVTIGPGDTSTHGDVPAGTYVELSVADTGMGMPPEVRARLFEPFFTTKPPGRGTGLGLATVHGIVKQSGGHIVVRSEEGAGTTFRIYLPVAPNPGGGSLRADGGHASDLKGTETILVIEDNPPLRRLTERMLRSYGYGVLVAVNGTQAREICAEHPGRIAVALVDIVMPDDSGPNIAAWIRGHRPATKIIFMSGYTREPERLLGHAFLQKPFTAPQLAGAVRDVLSGRDAAIG